jgi:hypothetical protein
MAKSDEKENGLLGHYDDNPFADVSTIRDVTDEQMLAMYDDPGHLKLLREAHGDSVTDEEFEVDVKKHIAWLKTCIAMREEEDEE